MSRTFTFFSIKPLKLFAWASILLFAGCSLEKKSALNRGLQNLTARYNILFNANEMLAAKQAAYETAYVDDYSELLSVYRDTAARNDEPDKDLTIVKAKANTIISVKEQSNYLGDAYLVLSKANFLDGNYFDAVEYANYVINSFSKDKDLKQEALIWKARALLYIRQPADAKVALDSALQNVNPKKKITADVYASKLQYDINVRDYTDGEEMAKLAVKYSHSKTQELRWTFILGQLQELNNKPADAIVSYNRIAKSNAVFDMAFNATLNRIRIEESQNGVKISRIDRLRLLLKNSNNKEFKDQIFYQIAELQYTGNDIDNALKGYRLSVNNSVKNTTQKGLSYLRMADIYFKNKADYIKAKNFYDSTLVNLSPNYPGYATIRKKSDNLQLLADRLQIIAREDTLQMLAALDETAREARIDQMVNNKILQLQQATAVTAAQAGVAVNVNQAPQESMPFGDNFYFNNANALGQGVAGFKRIWGNRKLEDNWRRSNRAASDITSNTAATIQGGDPDAVANNAQNSFNAGNYRQELVQNLPLTPAQLSQSNKRVFNAYLDMANFYRDVLNDKKEAIAEYELLLSRFPDNDSKPALYYNLYRLYSESDAALSDKYKNLLLTNYPQTPFAKTILNPEYGKLMNDDDTGFSISYNKVYELYARKQYTQVISNADALLVQYPNNRYAPQLYYLRAFAAGHQEPVTPFSTGLQQIVTKYPEDKLITPLVKQHLAYINVNLAELATRKVVLTDRDTNDTQFTLPIVYQQRTEYRIAAEPMTVVADVRKPEPKATEPKPEPKQTEPAQQPAPEQIEKASSVTSITNATGSKPAQALPPLNKPASPAKAPLTTSIFSMRDSTNYYFVVNVSTGTTNLSSSRFGIGQFNRVNFQDNTIKHQLKNAGPDNQLIYVGRFTSLSAVKDYARAIIPLMPDIMKVPKDKYSFFIITQENLDKLADQNTLNSYIDYYQKNY